MRRQSVEIQLEYRDITNFRRKHVIVSTAAGTSAAIALLGAAVVGGTAAQMSNQGSQNEAKRAEGQEKDQGRLKKQIQEEAAAAPGLAADEARAALLRRRKIIAKQGTTLLTGVGGQLPGEGKTLLGA